MERNVEGRRRGLLAELSELGGLVRGTIINTKRKCGRKECDCQRKGKLHPFRYLSKALGVGRSKIVYVKDSELAFFERGIAQYKRAKEILEELSDINAKLIKEGGYEGQG
jgi:hypothetical protein